jgi:hypothetical protein
MTSLLGEVERMLYWLFFVSLLAVFFEGVWIAPPYGGRMATPPTQLGGAQIEV